MKEYFYYVPELDIVRIVAGNEGLYIYCDGFLYYEMIYIGEV